MQKSEINVLVATRVLLQVVNRKRVTSNINPKEN